MKSLIHIIFPLLIILLLGTSAFGQVKADALLLTNNKKGTEVIIKQGQRVKVWTYTGEVYVGSLLIENDSIVITDQDKLALSSICKIKDMKDQKLGGILLGGGLVGTGILVYVVATGVIVTPALLPAIQGVLLIGIVAGTMRLISDKRYKAKKWKYEITEIEVEVITK